MSKVKIIDTPDLTLGSKDVVFEAKDTKGVVGKLLVSKGGVEWRGRNAKHGRHLSWKKLSEAFEAYGREVE